jgi:hypothetical protein
MSIKTHARGIVITALFTLAPGILGWWPNQIKAQVVEVPQFAYDVLAQAVARWVGPWIGG